VKKYLVIGLLCLSSLSFAEGQGDPMDYCNRSEISQCETCIKSCRQLVMSERNISNDKSPKNVPEKKNSKASATKQ
jgi:hypothetical protein